VSPNVAHGIPGNYRLKPSDIVNIDVSAEKNGYFADSGATFIVPPGAPTAERLCLATRKALEKALSVARHGNRLNEIGRAIEQVAKEYGYTVIENLGSHGVGRGLHEEPEFIPGYFDPKDKRILKENTVITIEPFLSNGARWVDERSDGWTLYTPDRFISAQYEHTLVITRGDPILITV
jgi:methionyl aminopeptidase